MQSITLWDATAGDKCLFESARWQLDLETSCYLEINLRQQQGGDSMAAGTDGKGKDAQHPKPVLLALLWRAIETACTSEVGYCSSVGGTAEGRGRHSGSPLVAMLPSRTVIG